MQDSNNIQASLHNDIFIVEQRCQCIVAVLQETINAIMPAKFQRVSYKHKYDRSFQWNSELTELKQHLVDIHALWRKVGKPKFGAINAERLRVKLKYKNYI